MKKDPKDLTHGSDLFKWNRAETAGVHKSKSEDYKNKTQKHLW